MAEDTLLKHQPLVDELKQSLGQASFSRDFAAKTAQLPKGDQFIIKMEFNRLRQPCSRTIDLRGTASGEVQSYSYKSQQHFMDAQAIATFEKGVARFGDYTMAVYEMVMEEVNNQRQLRQGATPQPENTEKSARVIHFASYDFRQQERMNYTIKVSVMVNDKTIEGKSSDISLGGCKLKLPSHAMLERGQKVQVRFTGLEEDFELGLKNGLEYEIVGIDPASTIDFYYARMKRTGSETTPGFDEFLARFINGNKRRYKVNLDNTLDAVLTKGYEQYYLPRVSSLFSFICVNDKKLTPKLLLTTENNAYIHYYFSDEERRSVLPSILNTQRISSILARKGQVKSTLLYSFSHTQNGKVFFYSATDIELATYPKLRSLFFSYASRKPSWRVFKLQLVPVQSEDSHIPLSLPDSAGEAIAKLNKPPSARVQSYLKGLKYLCTLSEVSSANLTAHKRRYRLDKSLVNQLKVFGHRKVAEPELEVVALEYANLRAHKRYLYQTEVTVESGLAAPMSAQSRDFSVLGMQIELSQPAPETKKGDVIYLRLPQLQEITKKFELTQLPYEVMAVSKTGTILNLKAYQKSKQPHVGVQFFSQLVENNKDKLQVCEEEPKVPGLSKALRNIVVKNLAQTPLYITKEEAHLELGAIGEGRYQSAIHHIWRQFGEFSTQINLKPLLSIKEFQQLSDTLRDGNRQDKPKTFDLFIRLNLKKDDLSSAVTSRCISTEEDYSSLLPFVNKALKSGLLFAFRLHLSKTGRPDTKYLISELKYISHYALHKAKELEQALWRVEGVIDALAIDELVPKLCDIEVQDYQKMLERRSLWLQRLG
ncbi:PilZ domain-containing protein [Pseudoalteromonas sp. CNC9-20]|uniref:PilZ domain-containing protein n=1 Tax=Pseudoalteromonas sp. CNC9-20 TaxID=2917750 RepID=UPI001EF64A64|nr:PilZ domain-containing protein [Pseudoalteromonas sp. CNC9-20]MCG7570218.1 PilZ domain-containing protein [Pseudoalteromonas sp. CNC9-20]